MGQYDVSIILPVFNGGGYLSECINSVIRQTIDKWELIIIDDGSTDNTREICENFVHIDRRIKYIFKENTGVSDSRNLGIKNANGTYICFIDADDMYSKNYLEIMLKNINLGYDIVCCDYTTEYDQFLIDDINKHIRNNKEAIDFIILDQKMNSVWRYIFKAEYAKQISFKPIKFAEDYLFVLDYLKFVEKSLFINSKIYYYRIDNPNSMLHNAKKRKYIDDYIFILKYFNSYFINNNLLDLRYKKKLGKEYAFCTIRLRRCMGQKEFKNIVLDKEFRKGLKNVKYDLKDLKKSLVLFLVKHRLLFMFNFIK